MIIWLASFPRSGNTFFRVLLSHLYGIKTYSIYNDPDLERIGASETVGHQVLPRPVAELAAASEVYFVKTHEVPNDAFPAIYLVRDGRDALVSFAHYRESFYTPRHKIFLKVILRRNTFQSTLRDCIVQTRLFGGWSGNVLAWSGRLHGPTFVIRYEDLVSAPVEWVQKSLEYFNLSQMVGNENVVPSFQELHDRWPNFFRKGKVGAWKQEMPGDLQDLFWQHHGAAMRTFKYN